MFKTLKVVYGANDTCIDVTGIVLKQCIFKQTIYIPPNDVERAAFFGDPLPGVVKHIKIEYQDVTTVYPHGQKILLTETPGDKPYDPQGFLEEIHARMKVAGGSIKDEYPEQIMSVLFIQPHNKVLEIGSNIGRNTLTIASLLSSPANLVTLESDPVSYGILCFNRDANGLPFHAHNAALSCRRMYQKDWITFLEGSEPVGAKEIATITWLQLKEKYPIEFDTLVADCEGALFYIFRDFPDLLDNIKLIIMENDYVNTDHMAYVDSVLHSKNFKCIYSKPGGWGPCASRFYEVWNTH